MSELSLNVGIDRKMIGLGNSDDSQNVGIEPIPVWREIGTGFSHMSGEATNVGKRNSSQITNGTFPIFHEWLSRRDEIIIPHERQSREWGIIISLQLLSQEWKIGNVP